MKTFPVEEKPMLEAQCERDEKGDVRVSWSAKSDSDALWYLVQWRDRDGTWRGCVPRTRKESLIIPGRLLWATKDLLRLRVLAVALLHTAVAECEVQAQPTEPPTDIIIRELPGGSVVRATIIDPIGRSLPTDDLRWYDEKGGELERGAEIVRRPGRRGVATVRPIAQGITGAEGYAVLDPAEGGADTSGCRPSGAAAEQILKKARFQHRETEE